MTTTTASDSLQKVCVSCGGPWHSGYKYCPACGSPSANTVSRAGGRGTALTARSARAIGLTAIVLLVGGSSVQAFVHWHREDKRPTKGFTPESQPHAHSAQAVEEEPVKDEQLDRLRADLQTDPNNVIKLKAVAVRIGELLRNRPSSPSPLALEAIDVLSSVVKQAPEDAEALILMADVSFDQRAFDKAREFYERYLKLSPEDLGARARYASTLTFLKKFDDGIAELNKVLSVDPNNFPAKAYLAITYAEKGDVEKAKLLAQDALKAAPNAEAKERFNGFVRSLEGQGTGAGAGSLPDDAATSNPVTQYLAGHPIAGSKFVKAQFAANGDLQILMRDFPMEGMPPVVREKFATGIKAKMPKSLKKVALIDEATGNTMAEVTGD